MGICLKVEALPMPAKKNMTSMPATEHRDCRGWSGWSATDPQGEPSMQAGPLGDAGAADLSDKGPAMTRAIEATSGP